MRNKKIIALALALVCYFSGSSQTIYSYQNWADGGAFGGRIVLPHDSTAQGSKTPKSDVLFIGWQMYTLGSDGHYHLLTGGGGGSQVQSDYNQTDNSQVDYIKNKPSISAVGLNGQWLSILNRPIVVRQDSTSPYSYPTWLAHIAWQTLSLAPDSTTYGYHTLGYYWAQFGHNVDSAIWKSDATYSADHTLVMNNHTQFFGAVTYNTGGTKKGVFIGTSITHGQQTGTSDTVGRYSDVATELIQIFGTYTQVNLGVSGNTVDEMIARIPDYDTSYAFMVVDAGTNELNDAIDSATFRAHYTDFMTASTATHAWPAKKIILISQMGHQIGQYSLAGFLGNNFVDSTLAKQFGARYCDAWYPELSPGMEYIRADSNVHPDLAASQLLGQIVAGAISDVIQFKNDGQSVVVAHKAQIGDQIYKNLRAVTTPHILATDDNGNMGWTNQLPDKIRTQGRMDVGGGMAFFGRDFSFATTYIPTGFVPYRDILLGQGVVVHKSFQLGIADENTLDLGDVNGNVALTLNHAGTTATITAPIVDIAASGGLNISGLVKISNGLNVQNTQIVGDYSGGTINDIELSQNGTRNTLFQNREASGKYIFTSSLGIAGYEAQDLVIFPNGDMVVGKTLFGDTLADEPSSQFTVGTGPTGIYFDKGSIPNVRMTTTQRDAIASPTDGLHVYNTTTEQDEYYNATTAAWTAVGASISTMPFSQITTTGTMPTVVIGGAVPSGGSVTSGNTTTSNGVRGGWGFTSGTGSGSGATVMTFTIPTQPSSNYVVVFQQTSGPFVYVVPTSQTTTSFIMALGTGASPIGASASYSWNYWIIN